MKSVALVIPCKDESRRLDDTAFLDAVRDIPYLTLLFVNDGSTDDTCDRLAFLERQSPSIRALDLTQNVGKAEAVRTGVNWLLRNTSCEAVGFWDADLATPLSELPRFVEALERDVRREAAIGARWPHLGANIDRSVFRHCTGGVMKTLIRLVLHAPVYDTQCGAKLFRRKAAEQVFATPFRTRWLFDVELLRRLGVHQLAETVVELPLSSWSDIGGSKFTFRESLRVFPELLKIACGGILSEKMV